MFAFDCVPCRAPLSHTALFASFAEGEEELDWLKQTGFDSLVSLPETASEEVTEDLSMLNSLSIQQVG